MLFILGVGIYMERRAGKDMESYFLGNKRIPWLLLGMSGSSSGFDITGTMWMVSVFYLLGMRGMWEHAFWCFPFAGFMMAYKAKWAYRSGVLTGAEWFVFRFGRGRAGEAARLMTVIIALVYSILMLGYAGTGVGKFMEEFLPFDRAWMVPFIFGFTGLYVVLGGFFSVVYSDFFQTILMAFACIYIAVAAFIQVDPAAFETSVGTDWFSLAPVMRLAKPVEQYPDPFGWLVVLWVTRGVLALLAGSGGSTFQRFRAAHDEAGASKTGLAWGLTQSTRWSLAIAFTVFGLSILATNGEAVDSERVLPMVLNRVLPVGVKGLLIAALMAAFMSTFDTGINLSASYIVNDLIKPLWKRATARQLMRVSYVATLAVIALGILISHFTESIAAIWNPINFALGAALLVPTLLAPYWWRIGGWTYCVSGAITLPVAGYIKLFTDMRELQYFPILASTSLVSCLVAAYLLPAAPKESLMEYYRKVRPFGFWRPARRMLEENGESSARFARDRYDIPVGIVGTVLFVLLYIAMMDVVLHNWVRLAYFAIGLAACSVFLYFFWWRVLAEYDSAADDDQADL